MGNLIKFLRDKNTVTFICVIIGVVVLYVGYNIRVNNATNPVSIPYAKKELTKKTKITAEVIGHTNVPNSLIKDSKTIITQDKLLINKYVSYATNIPVNSYFYDDVVMEEEEMPDYAFMSMPDGYTVYSLKVNMSSTYANKIFPNTYIDLYAKATDSTSRKIIFARLIASIKVKAVKDDAGNSLLENGVNNGTPAALLFEVENEMFDLLKKAEYVDDVEIIPVPRNSNYTGEAGDTMVESEVIKNHILSQCVNITE